MVTPAESVSSPQLEVGLPIVLQVEDWMQEMIEAIDANDVSTVESILSNGLDPNARYNNSEIQSGEDDATLLHWAVRFHSTDCVKERRLLRICLRDMNRCCWTMGQMCLLWISMGHPHCMPVAAMDPLPLHR